MATTNTACPCGSARPYPDCCGRYHAGEAAPTAEALMRSRYSAYVLQQEEYLLQSWHPETRPAELHWEDGLCWLGLKIVQCHGGSAVDQQGTVAFVARHKLNGCAARLHETSRFVRVQGRWYYLDGDVERA